MHIDELAKAYGVSFNFVRVSRKGNMVMSSPGGRVYDLGNGRAWCVYSAWAVVHPVTHDVLDHTVETDEYEY